MKRLFAVLIFLSGLLFGATANADNFAGFYMTAGGALQAYLTEYQSKNGNEDYMYSERTDLGQQKLRPRLAVGYYLPLNEKYLIGFETGMLLGSGPGASRQTISAPSSQLNTVEKTSWSTGQEWFIALKPAMRLSPNTLGFLMLTHHGMSGRASYRSGVDCTNPTALTDCTDPEQSNFSRRLSGTGIGIGLDTLLTPNMFLQMSIERISYSAARITYGDGYKDTFKPTSITGVMSIGYRF